ncbi:MAG: hypothetical protein JKY11_00900 [Alphaproteobacteria bacterium]|nr:hypothetical protein [Alphaproteobacteria bacterium]
MGYEQKRTERGNVLFLILIAVALFAALSYAVTQSTRGGGNADDETSLISSAALTQYPAGLSTTLLRMSFNGVSDTDYMFNPPSDDTACIADASGVSACVFLSDGGGASYQLSSSDVVTGATGGTWVFNGDNEINDIGSTAAVADAPTIASREILAILPNITNSVCTKINEELGIVTSPIPVETGIDVGTTYLDDTTNGDAPVGGTIGEDVVALDGQPFGCFEQGGFNYYYHTLTEN